MKTKIIATIVALVMVAMAFAALPTVSAQASHVWATSSDGYTSGNIANAADLTSPDGGLGRHYIQTRPGEVVLGATTPNPASSHDCIGTIMPNLAQVDSEGFASPSLNGDPTIFICERDITAAPSLVNPIMVQVSSMAGGNVPNGYVASAPVASFLWAEPLGFGAFLDSTLTKIPSPTLTATNVNWVAMAGVPNIYGYGVLESAANNGPWTEVGQSTGTTLVYAPVTNNWYSLVIYWAGTGAGFLNTQAVRGAVFGAPTQYAIATNDNALTSGGAEAGTLLAGNHNAQTLTITASVSDIANEGDLITGAEISVDSGAWTAMAAADGAFDEVTEGVTYLFTAPFGYYATGIHNYQIRADDNGVPQGAYQVYSDSFTIVDTTAPDGAYTSAPTAIYTTQPASFIIGYEDFTAYNPAVTDTYITWQLNGGGYTNYALVNDTFAWGTYTNIFTYSIAGGTFVDGDTIDYNVRLEDSNNNFILLGAGSFTVSNAPPGVQDPYPIYGYLYLYNGAGMAYTPVADAGGSIVTATWISSFDGSTLTRTDTTNALGQFSIDLLNYTDGAQVWLTATFAATGNAGYNYTTVDIVGFPGGRLQNVLCGIPYQVTITAPIPLATEVPGAIFPATYVWYDIDGVICQGYYTFVAGTNGGLMTWYSGDPLFVPPAGYQFDGLADAGTHTDNLQLWTGGLQWINVSENGNLELPADNYPTPWGAIQIPTTFVGGAVVLAQGWYDDWDNITLMVVSGGFDWHVVVGWNIVSVPQDPVEKGLNGVFDSYDALVIYCWELRAAGVTDLALADRIPGNPSSYNVFDFTMAEGVAFPMDGVHGYWVYSDVAAVCHFNSTNYTNWGVANVLNAAAGWNLVGFTHNYTWTVGWTVLPTASDFTVDGTVSLTPGLGAVGKIVATEWLEDAGPQWYNSYVDMAGFPGMPTHDWVWDNSYSTNNPANGLFLWLEAPAVITFDTEY